MSEPGPPPPPPPLVRTDELTGARVLDGTLDGRSEAGDQLVAGMDQPAVRRVIDRWAERTEALGSRHDVGYVLIVQERNMPSRLYGFPTVPPTPARELAVHPCPLCYELATHRLVAEGMGFRAWVPAAAISPTAVTVAPLGHRSGLPALTAWERDAFAALLVDVLGLLEGTFQLWVHQAPTDGREWPNAHVHLEIVDVSPGAAELASGLYFNPVSPLDGAARLRALKPVEELGFLGLELGLGDDAPLA